MRTTYRALVAISVLLFLALLATADPTTIGTSCATANSYVYGYWNGDTDQFFQVRFDGQTANLPGSVYCVNSAYAEECTISLGDQISNGFTIELRECTDSSYATCGAWTTAQGPFWLTNLDESGVVLTGADLNGNGTTNSVDYSMLFAPALGCGAISNPMRSFILTTPPAP